MTTKKLDALGRPVHRSVPTRAEAVEDVKRHRARAREVAERAKENERARELELQASIDAALKANRKAAQR